ncbi:MAG TPA: hypothetical protein K8W24_10635 [Brachybacterium paraconglomeratum]|uniref:Uncharacterized protein n=1 Tax=Brachybacterium paraconglomeratum TaxID=173362 RepID=A0A921GQ63_9MICO|nr:hypothetical protein [Brachybacterium paraconglomeratum]
MDQGEHARSGGRHRFVLGPTADGPGRDGPGREGPGPAGAGRDGAAGDRTGREEESLGAPGREDALRVRWRGPDGRESVTAEMQLLAALEVAGISAAPDVIGMEEDGYIRETAPPLARRRGRRAADGGAPATGERVAQARAREDLEAFVASLHERGWVLGAPRGRGLGVRADGSVLVLDLSGMRREQSLAVRSADLHWIDSVLEDEERTLRRRVHALPGAGAPSLDLPGFLVTPAGTGPTDPPRVPGEQGVPDREDAAEADSAEADVAADASVVAPLPAPRLRRARTQARAAGGGDTGSSRRRGSGGALSAVLGERRHRRTALLSGAVVLALGLGAAAAITLTTDRPEPARQAPAVVAGGAPSGAGASQEGQVPEIEDPWALAAELAGSRHSYLTGASDVPVAAEGGAAQEEDERIRTAYEGYEVQGSGPVVHEAELLEGPDEDGIAVLRVLVSTEAGQVREGSGIVQETSDSGAYQVDLVLVWDGARWRIFETRTA